MNKTAAPPIQAWLAGTLALDLTTVPAEVDLRLRRALTLYQRGYNGEQNTVGFWREHEGWLHLPRGYPLTQDGAWLRDRLSIRDGRAQGFDLPPGTHVGVVFGAEPHPPGQPQFIDDMVAGARANAHGGLALAPTRAGKTLTAIEAACRLGGSFLVLVDRQPLLDQWVRAVQDHVRDLEGRPLPVGIIKGDRFDTPPEYPVVVAMIQTLVRRSLDRDTRRAWRTTLVDECQSAPCTSIWSALERVESAYVLGLSATPDRKDGLTRAISWTIGPQIATLKRDLTAEVHFLQVPWANTHVPKRRGSKNFREPRLVRGNGLGVDINEAEKSLLRDEHRLDVISTEVGRAVLAGRRVLVLVRLREHAKRLAATLQEKLGYRPGVYMPPTATPEQMAKNPTIATYGIAAKGIDFQPPPTLCVLAGPRRDVRQAVGRVLQPQAPHTPLILDVVDGVKPLLGQAYARLAFYRDKGFKIRNEVWG